MSAGKAYAVLFISAVLLRVALLAVALTVVDLPLDVFLSQSDAGSFLKVGERIYGGAAFQEAASGYHERVFLGWPLLFGWGVWLGVPALVLFAMDLLLAGAAPCLFYRLSGDWRLSLVLCYFTPAWLVHSTYPMAEAAYLTSGLASLVLLVNRRLGPAGLLLGLMGTIRPTALALLLGFGAVLWRSWKKISTFQWVGFALGLALFPAVGLWLNWTLHGDPLHQLRVYATPLESFNVTPGIAERLQASGHWGPPFYWLVKTPLATQAPWSKTAYIFGHVLLLIVAAVPAIRDLARKRLSDPDLAMRVWLLATAALIVSAGPYWGFHSFDRYFVWAWPPVLWVLRYRIPFDRRFQAPLFGFSLLVACYIMFR